MKEMMKSRSANRYWLAESRESSRRSEFSRPKTTNTTASVRPSVFVGLCLVRHRTRTHTKVHVLHVRT